MTENKENKEGETKTRNPNNKKDRRKDDIDLKGNEKRERVYEGEIMEKKEN